MEENFLFNKKDIMGIDESLKVDHKNAFTFDVKSVTPSHKYSHLNRFEMSKYLIQVMIRDVVNKLNHNLLKNIENTTIVENINKKNFINELENNKPKNLICSTSQYDNIINHHNFKSISLGMNTDSTQMYKLGNIKNSNILIEPNLKWNEKTMYILYDNIYNFDYKYIFNVSRWNETTQETDKENKIRVYCTYKKNFNSKRYILNE